MSLVLLTAAVVAALWVGWHGGRLAFLLADHPFDIDWGPAQEALTAPEPPPQPPWRTRVPDAVELPLDVVRAFAVPADRARAAADLERVRWIADQITADGIQDAMCIRVDQCGRATLEDGHHRCEAAVILGYVSWPVQFKRSERITGHGRPVQQLVEALAGLLQDGAPSCDDSDPNEDLWEPPPARSVSQRQLDPLEVGV